MVGLLVSLLTLVPAVGGVHIGRWVDRIGFRRPAAAGMLLLLGGNLLAAFLPSILALGIASVMVGSGFMLCHVAGNHVIGWAVPAALRGRAFGLTSFGYSLASFSGPLLAGVSVDLVGHSAVFVVLAVPAALAGALLARDPAGVHHEPVVRPAGGGPLDLLRDPTVRSVLVVSSLLSAGWDLFNFLVPLHAVRSGLSASAVGLVSGAFGAGAACVRLALPALVRRLGDWTLLRTALLGSACGYVLMPLCGTASTLVPLALALGMVLGVSQPIVMTLLHAVSPPGRTGEAVGLRTALTSVTQTLLPLVSGAFGAALGLAPLFWAIAAGLGVGGFVQRHAPRRPD